MVTYTDTETAYWTLSTIATTAAALLGLIVVAAVFYIERFFRYFLCEGGSRWLTAFRRLLMMGEFLWFVIGFAIILTVGIGVITNAIDQMEIVPAIESTDEDVASGASDLIDDTRVLHRMLLETMGIYSFGWLLLGAVNMILAKRSGDRRQPHIDRKHER